MDETYEYYIFDNGIPLPARRLGMRPPQIWSMGKWSAYINPEGWHSHAEVTDKATFDALCKKLGVKE